MKEKLPAGLKILKIDLKKWANFIFFVVSSLFVVVVEAKVGTKDNQKENNKHNEDDNSIKNKEEAE